LLKLQDFYLETNTCFVYRFIKKNSQLNINQERYSKKILWAFNFSALFILLSFKNRIKILFTLLLDLVIEIK
jgi:hypothetical protein